MKTQKTLFSTSILILLVSILFSSCGWNKRMQASKKNKHNADSIANISNNKVKVEPKNEIKIASDSFLAQYQLSEREGEIIAYLIKGQNNQESFNCCMPIRL
mgnify:CR=1 FL=1